MIDPYLHIGQLQKPPESISQVGSVLATHGLIRFIFLQRWILKLSFAAKRSHYFLLFDDKPFPHLPLGGAISEFCLGFMVLLLNLSARIFLMADVLCLTIWLLVTLGMLQ